MADPALQRNTGHISFKQFYFSDMESHLLLFFSVISLFIRIFLRVTTDIFPPLARSTLPLEGGRTKPSLSRPWPPSTPCDQPNTTVFCPAIMLFNP